MIANKDELKEVLLKYSQYLEKQVPYKLFGLTDNWIKHINNFSDTLALGKPEPLAKNKQTQEDCDHPFAYVMSKCNGEINKCLKCGKQL